MGLGSNMRTRGPRSYAHSMPANTRIIFITGTDTGVGKTLLTALLLVHLRNRGRDARAVKPFCSGSRADVRLLCAAQDKQLTATEVNPFYFPEPLAPLAAARKHRRLIQPEEVLTHIAQIANRCEYLLIEGAGGLLVPLAPGFTTLELIARLHCSVIAVSRNKLGTINHTLLTVRALQRAEIPNSRRSARTYNRLKIVLMNHRRQDASFSSNPQILAEFLFPLALFTLPFLGPNCRSLPSIQTNAKKNEKTLARILG